MGKAEEVTALLADNWLTPSELAQRLGQSEATLANWRQLAKWRGRYLGPVFLKIGRNVFYPSARVEEWLRSRPRAGAGPP